MTAFRLFLLIGVFFVTSGISVVTGSTSVITVPTMLQFGIESRLAVATNMFALTLMSIGGTLPFLRPPRMVNRLRLRPLIFLTLVGSAAGAILLLVLPAKAIPAIVSSAVIGLAVFSLFYRRSGSDASPAKPSRNREIVGYVVTFVLGIYGGLFSGGYVTILTAIFVAAFGMSFIEAVATTKFINIFSSGIATAVFMWRGVVDYRLGIVLGTAMFIGALLGGRYARRLGNLWIRRIYLAAVWMLGLKTLFVDVLYPDASSMRGHRAL